jgi:hypothetical protein
MRRGRNISLTKKFLFPKFDFGKEVTRAMAKKAAKKSAKKTTKKTTKKTKK